MAMRVALGFRFVLLSVVYGLGALSSPHVAHAQPGMTPADPVAPSAADPAPPAAASMAPAPPSMTSPPPPPVLSVEDRRRASRLTAQAMSAAHAGQCSAASSAGAGARAIDPQYYQRALATDAALAACEARVPPGSVAPPAEPTTPTERGGILFGIGFGVGDNVRTLDLRLGAMITPWLGIFASLIGVGAGHTIDGGFGFLGGGVRISRDRLFLDLRAGESLSSSGCDFDDPCTSYRRFAGFVGGGVELIQSRVASLDLHLETIVVRHLGHVITAGASLSFY